MKNKKKIKEKETKSKGNRKTPLLHRFQWAKEWNPMGNICVDSARCSGQVHDVHLEPCASRCCLGELTPHSRSATTLHTLSFLLAVNFGTFRTIAETAEDERFSRGSPSHLSWQCVYGSSVTVRWHATHFTTSLTALELVQFLYLVDADNEKELQKNETIHLFNLIVFILKKRIVMVG